MVRPYVILNAAMTVDGKISSVGGDSEISCGEDLDRVHSIRSEVDAVMVGVGTVLSDDPKLTVRRVNGKNPVRVIVDSSARTPTEANVFSESAGTILAVSEGADKRDLDKVRSLGVEVIQAGRGKVDLKSLLEILSDNNIDRVLLEGGSTLNWSMLNEGLVDEVRVAISPCIVGGENAKTLVEGEGANKIADGIKLELKRANHVGRDLSLVYKVKGFSNDQNDQ